MTNKPNTDKTIEMIKYDLAREHMVSPGPATFRSSFLDGFDAAIQLCEQRERDLVKALGAQVAELKIISSRNADNWIKHLNISTKQSEAIEILRGAVDKNMEISGNVNLTRPLRQGDKEFMNDCSDEVLKIYKNSKETLSKVDEILGKENK